MGNVTLVDFLHCLAHLIWYFSGLLVELLLLVISGTIVRVAGLGLPLRIFTAFFLIGLLLLLWYPVLPLFEPHERHDNVQLYEIFQYQLFQETRSPPIVDPTTFPEESLARLEIYRDVTITEQVEYEEELKEFAEIHQVGWGTKKITVECEEDEVIELPVDDLEPIVEIEEVEDDDVGYTNIIDFKISLQIRGEVVATTTETTEITEIVEEETTLITDPPYKRTVVHFSPSILEKPVSSEEFEEKPPDIPAIAETIKDKRPDIEAVSETIVAKEDKIDDNIELVISVVNSEFRGDIDTERADICESSSDELQKIEKLVTVLDDFESDSRPSVQLDEADAQRQSL